MLDTLPNYSDVVVMLYYKPGDLRLRPNEQGEHVIEQCAEESIIRDQILIGLDDPDANKGQCRNSTCGQSRSLIQEIVEDDFPHATHKYLCGALIQNRTQCDTGEPVMRFNHLLLAHS
jgi:hypothetical protein